jgi:GxxExxY protein
MSGYKKRVWEESEIAQQVAEAAALVHTQLGPGLRESVYETALALELKARGFEVARQQAIAVEGDVFRVDEGFRADVVVEDKVLVELKSAEALPGVHHRQLRSDLRLAGKRIGVLIEIGRDSTPDNVRRVMDGPPD